MNKAYLPLFIILLLTACATGPPERIATPSATSIPPSATASPSPSSTPVPTVSPTHTPFVPKATIKIAVHFPMSGDLGSWGSSLANAVELAISENIPSFEVQGLKLELITYDDENDISVAVGNAKELVADPEIICGVGNFTSRIFLQTQQVYHNAGLPFIAPSTTSPTVTQYGYLEVNRVVGRDDMQGGVAAMFAEAQGYKRAFVVSQTNDYASLNAYQFRTEAPRGGVEIVGVVKTDAENGFMPIVDALISSGADVVYFSTRSAEQAGAFFREAREAGYQGTFLGPDGLNNPSLLNTAGPFAVEDGGIYFSTHAIDPHYFPEAANFISDFEIRFGEAPQGFSAQAYDAASICMRAILDVYEENGTDVPTRVEVANAIRALEGYEGISGTYTFDKNGDLDPASYLIFRVNTVDPNDWDQNEMVALFELPPPE